MSSLINVVVILAVVTSGVLVAPAVAYPEYIAELPTLPKHARGVGHVSAEGGGLRNKFGQDFAAAGHTWTKELCQADSDGDGYSNGEELGDPNCTVSVLQPAAAA
uniref:Temptin Cys/Cys disulfide domain-containing protein n=1 Tax=Tetradesmus obliquus TaxID=3088 RepID=A0A383VW56_TETOB|eukprot:jgi/Sobl393_1/9411/SZX69093.1